ncbi:MAG: hypothetical protein LBM93_07015 [Oscillospiraceae bacterium]|jgi:hypothetical protein|nr:hypothetical protein [Oscillospiraceae bacterium]
MFTIEINLANKAKWACVEGEWVTLTYTGGVFQKSVSFKNKDLTEKTRDYLISYELENIKTAEELLEITGVFDEMGLLWAYGYGNKTGLEAAEILQSLCFNPLLDSNFSVEILERIEWRLHKDIYYCWGFTEDNVEVFIGSLADILSAGCVVGGEIKVARENVGDRAVLIAGG